MFNLRLLPKKMNVVGVNCLKIKWHLTTMFAICIFMSRIRLEQKCKPLRRTPSQQEAISGVINLNALPL